MISKKLLSPKNWWIVPAIASGLAFGAPVFDPDSVSATGAIQPVGYVGSPIAGSYVLSGTSTPIYVIDYSVIDWSGDLHAYSMSAAGAISKVDNSVWSAGSAGTQLDAIAALSYNATRRNIVTWNDKGVSFLWANLSVTQQTAVGGQSVLDFIRGDTTNEAPNGLKYRNRGSVLGDIIHSTPVRWNDGTNKTIFVGANDGMLHAFNELTGAERFAYIPSQLISKLPSLKDSAYQHRYFVDGQLAARRFVTNDTKQDILVGALGGGGKGLFGLDITAVPTNESTAATKILWEISSASTGFSNLGNVYGTPLLTTLPSGVNALIVGNGYNNSGNGHSSLFIINPVTGAKSVEIDAGTGTAAAPNGLSSPTLVDTDLDGKSDYAYAGDVDGNLWKFDLSGNTATLLYTTSPAQAITMAPSYRNHPLGGRMVVFVTGKNFTAADEIDASVHYAYGIWDRPAAYANNNTLLAQTLSEVAYTDASTSIRVRTATSNVPDWTARTAGNPTTTPTLGTANHMGWRTPLKAGERVVGDGAFVTNSIFIFLTGNPTISPTATPPGENWWMHLNAITGGDNNAVRFDLDGDGKFTDSDQISGKSPVGRYMGGGIRSQFTAFTTLNYEIYQANYDKNGDPPSTSSTSTTESGVAGGHFDFDVYYGANLTENKGKFSSTQHKHEYDDIYNVTGVNMLNSNNSVQNLSKAIAADVPFKVIAHNQYLSPAARLHLNGSPSYIYNVDQGYIDLKTYSTQSDVTKLQASLSTYTLGTVKSFAINLPVNAFVQKDWWGGYLGLAADVRAGLHPTKTDCVKQSETKTGGNLYKPVTSPARVLSGGTVTGTGNGSIPDPQTSGVRHNGALTIQIIKADTPDNLFEMNVAGSPEYGWRIKSANYSAQVLAEYTMFWHKGDCYGDSGWIKTLTTDPPASTAPPATTPNKDPKIGSFSTGPQVGTTTSTDPITGTVTTIVTVLNLNGTYTTTKTITTRGGGSTSSTATTNSVDIGGAVGSAGVIGSGVTTPSDALGRVNWRELRR